MQFVASRYILHCKSTPNHLFGQTSLSSISPYSFLRFLLRLVTSLSFSRAFASCGSSKTFLADSVASPSHFVCTCNLLSSTFAFNLTSGHRSKNGHVASHITSLSNTTQNYLPGHVVVHVCLGAVALPRKTTLVCCDKYPHNTSSSNTVKLKYILQLLTFCQLYIFKSLFVNK